MSLIYAALKRLGLVGLVVFGGASALAQPSGTRYYVTLYGWENWRNAPAFSHSFGEFTEVQADGQTRTVKINWIPVEGEMPGLRPLRMPAFGVHRGQNAEVGASIDRARQGGFFTRRDVYSFGPYETRAELFELAAHRAAELESGRVNYSFFDPNAPHCIRALLFGPANIGITRGPGATQAVLESYVRAGYILSSTPAPERFPKLSGHRNGDLIQSPGPARQPLFPRLRR